ncbi:AAA family ATPase [Curtobacterium sp. MCBD17_019]|uniref:AAA family ATPase n=1 Tax=Curtobacterium sp. MCBD17_019 TaxID=2175669 RepID=UPI000DA8B9E7|nr:AAA family ATPase [Curtobacterium sp. MCBD17_019]PZE71571.1 AAA family ATPase [Curtobacterium sp. MCBD17_019]
MLDSSDRLTPPPQRVLVAGPSGAGKTTFAQQIERVAGLPHTEVDALFHGPGWTPRPDFVEAVDAFTREPRWVTEWAYTSQLGNLVVSRADTLVALDYPVLLHMSRLVLRTIRRSVRRVELWNGNVEPPLRTFFGNPEHIIRWGWKGRARIRANVVAAERDWPQLRVVRLRSQRQADAWLRSLAL